MKKTKFNNYVSLIKNAINNDKLVVFAGAGVSKDSGVPLWSELIEEIRGYLNEDINENDPLKIAQILYNEKGEKEYNDIIKKSLFRNKGIYNPLHEILFELNPQHIITTNYDHFFESIIENKGLPFSVVSKDIDLPYAEHKSLLIKYHGDFENKNIVFKEIDYLEFSKNNTLKEIFVKSLFSNKVILFVGYSVGDINLKLLIRDIQFILTKHHQRAYLLSHNNNISNSENKYFENLGINIINYCDESLKTEKDKNESSSIGELVYKQLEYIRDFDLFEYERSKSNISTVNKIIDDLYSSLLRFHYFRVIPKRVLASLYPLNKNSDNDTIYNIESTTLITYNKDLFNLINEYKGKEDTNFSDEQKRKLNFVFTRLIYSNVFYIGRKIGGKDVLGNRRTGEEIVLFDKFFNENKTCNCIDCTIGSFKYSSAISKIESYNITDDSKLWDDVVFAYSLYQMGEYYKAYKTYEQIEIKANRLKQMDVSFISLYNMKRIGIRIQGFHLLDKRYSFYDLKEIEIKSKKIDTDAEFYKIKYFVDKDVYNFLKEVRDGIYIQRLCNEIDNFYNKIPKDVKNIQRGGSVSNSDYFNLYNAVKQLNDFLKGNFIMGNGFSSIEYSINKSIKTFILGFYIGTLKLNYNQKNSFGVSKLDSFNHFLFELIIDYNKPDELADFIREQKILDIKFDEESQKSVFELITNFFKSAFEENKFFGGKKGNDVFTNYLNYSYNFKQKILLQLQNICIVLTYFEFTEIQIKSIYSDFNQFIKFTNFGERDELKLLKLFISTRYRLIGYELLLETLNIFNEKKYYDSIYITILKSLEKINSQFVDDITHIDSLNFEFNDYNILNIYETLSIEKKANFIEKVEIKLKERFDTTLVFILLLKEVPINKLTKNEYIKTIHKKLETKEKVTQDDYENFYFLNPIVQYFELINLGIIKDKKLLTLKIEAELFKFIINPEEFDENKFDINWLIIFHYDSYIIRFSKIDYIKEKLENYLIKNDDEKLQKIYFKILKNQKD
ncbi:MAG: SIR2 family protein [Flavobacteriales bacterium]|nr:SIR2 family protein [Flavobacteriales bacterium]